MLKIKPGEEWREKTCKWCGQTLPITSFGFEQRSPDGRKSSCRNCVKAGMCKRQPSPEGIQRCSRCKADKPPTLEYFSPGRPGKFNAWCRDCANAWKKAKTAEKAALRPVDHLPEGMQRCQKCQKVLPATEDHFY